MSIAQLSEVLVVVYDAVDEQCTMLHELAELAATDDPAGSMLRARASELTEYLARLKPMLASKRQDDATAAAPERGGEAPPSAGGSRRPSRQLMELRDLQTQQQQTSGTPTPTPREEQLRLRASAICSAQRSLEAQGRRLLHLSVALPAMQPALEPLLAGLQAESSAKLAKLLEHTVRQLEMQGRYSASSRDQQLAWLEAAEADTDDSSTSSTLGDADAFEPPPPPTAHAKAAPPTLRARVSFGMSPLKMSPSRPAHRLTLASERASPEQAEVKTPPPSKSRLGAGPSPQLPSWRSFKSSPKKPPKQSLSSPRGIPTCQLSFAGAKMSGASPESSSLFENTGH